MMIPCLLACALIAPATPAHASVDGPPGARGTVGKPTFGIGGFGLSQGGPTDDDPVMVSVEAGVAQVRPDGDVPVAIVFDLAPSWHIWPNERPIAGDMAKYDVFDGAIWTTIEVLSASDGITAHAGFIQWPPVHAFTTTEPDGTKTYAVFEGRSIAYLPVTVSSTAKPGKARVDIKVGWQACRETCLAPETKVFAVEFEVVGAESTIAGAGLGKDFKDFPPDVFGRIRAGEAPPSLVVFDLFEHTFVIDANGAGFLLLLLVAAIGGLLLNLTPCVLPVIPLKIMGLSASAGHPARCFALGVSMSLGVVAFWLAIGGAIAGLVSGFTSINQLFQYPWFTIGVGVVIAIMALGMSGLFSVSLPQWVYAINPKHDSHLGSFGFGVMTAVLSTPCTAPLMGAAAAWATKQPATTTLAVFGAIGAGMALPYLVLSAFPKLVSKMPRTGPASELVKQVMGLLLLAAAAYFIGAGLSSLFVTPPNPPSRFFWWVVAALGAGAGAWLLWRTVRITSALGLRVVFGGIGAMVAALSVYIGISQTAAGPIKWTYYTPERFDQALADGKVVVLDFTAEWCLNCKLLESTVLFADSVAPELALDRGVAPIKVDLTGNNVLGNERLVATQSVTIPWLVVYAPDGTEVFKSAWYTQQQVLDAIEKAKSLKVAAR